VATRASVDSIDKPNVRETPLTSEVDAKSRAAKFETISCWTNDPCGAVDGQPGTGDYARRLIHVRTSYAPWMADVLGHRDSAGVHILDVGCGQGIDLMQAAKAGANITGIDLTPRHVELARAHLAALGLRGRVIEADAEQLPFPDGSFDRVISNGVLHHTPDIAVALREIRRVLRPGGEARLIVYHRNSVHYWGEQVIVQGLVKRHGILRNVERSSVSAKPLVRVYSRRGLRRLLNEAGFSRAELSVHQFDPSDFVLTHRLRRLLSPAAREWVGERAGWFLAARAIRPETSDG
jgi:ubiquinone/menaquinone biosynthesis C-methylase UbiE